MKWKSRHENKPQTIEFKKSHLVVRTPKESMRVSSEELATEITAELNKITKGAPWKIYRVQRGAHVWYPMGFHELRSEDNHRYAQCIRTDKKDTAKLAIRVLNTVIDKMVIGKPVFVTSDFADGIFRSTTSE